MFNLRSIRAILLVGPFAIGISCSPGEHTAAGDVAQAATAPSHTRCGWIGSGHDFGGHAAFVTHAASFQVIHPMWYALGSDSQSVTIGPLANNADLVSAASANHVQIWPTVDGGLDKTVIQRLIHDASKRAAHIQNLVNLATNNGYSGLDLDYEHLWDPGDRADFSQLAREFGAAMHAAGLKASMAITAIDAATGAYDYNALVAPLDVIHIMGYDRHGVGGTHIGPGDPIGWIQAAETYAVSTGFPMRFILGVPNFGFTLSDACQGDVCSSRCTSSISFTDTEFETSCPYNTGVPKWKAGRSPNCMAPNNQQPSTLELQYFEDVASLEERVASARASGLAGVTYWSLGNEPAGLFDMFERYFPIAGGGAPRARIGTDVNSDGKGDFLARDASGNWQVWISDGTKFVNTATFTSNDSDANGFNVASRILAMDLNGDGRTDLLLRTTTGVFEVYLSNATTPVFDHEITTTLSDANGWTATNRLFPADVNGDGKTDLLARQTNGTFQIWLSDGTNLVSSGTFATGYSDTASYGSGNRFSFLDLTGDGRTDFLVRGGNGSFDVWTSTGASYANTSGITASYSDAAGFNAGDRFFAADVNGDRKDDLLVRNSNGVFDVWLSNGANLARSTTFTTNFSDANGAATGNRWFVRDINGDGRTDVAFRHVDGSFSTWISNGTILVATTDFATVLTDASGWSTGFRFF